ncbi:MAG: hypothetical protein ACKOSS_03625 [Planctomycetia bacterium]
MQLAAGTVISKALEITTKNLPTLFLIALVVMVPVGVLNHLLSPRASDVQVTWKVDQESGAVTVTGGAQPSMGKQLLALVVSMVGQAVVTAAMAYAVFQALRGQKADVATSLQKGMGFILPVIGVSVCYGLGVALGLILLVVPGIIVACMWYVSVPAAVVESLGVGAALSRSAGLTSGNRMAIFVMNLIVFLLLGLVMFALAGVFFSMGVVVGVALSILVGTFVALFGATLTTVCYHELRVGKEGATTEEMAKIFG